MQQRNRIRVTLVVLACLMSAAPVLSGDDRDADGVVAGIQTWLDGTRTLRGRFEQTLLSGALGAGLKESGKLFVERPGRMRWEYTEPERKIALIVDDRTWLYLEEDEQLIRGRLGEEGELLPMLLAGTERIDAFFDASLLATPDEGGDGRYRLKLVPRGGSDSFRQVVLTTQPPGFALESAEVLDPAGNRLLYAFKGLKRNRGIPPGLFVFEPPPGTLVTGDP